MYRSFSIILTNTMKPTNHFEKTRFLLSEKPETAQIPGQTDKQVMLDSQD